MEASYVLLDDVGDEFNSLDAVRHQMLKWKLTYANDYQQTFAELSLPMLFDFFIRLEMISFSFEDVSQFSFKLFF